MLPLKRNILSLLQNNDLQGITRLEAPPFKIINNLISLSYDKKSTVSWRAMEAIGLYTAEMAKEDTEFVRNVVGRLLWMIRDESGGIGWSVPEILSEIVRNNPVLCADIAPIIISFYEELMLATAVLWAAGNMGELKQDTVDYAIPLIRPFLTSPDDVQRGYAARALGSLGASDCRKDIEELLADDSSIPVYSNREVTEKTVREIASEALGKL